MNSKIAGLSKSLRAALALSLAWASFAQAAAPNVLSYQGRLKESGLPVNGLRTVDLALCDAPAAGNCYLSGAQSVQVSTGLFRANFTVPASVNLGSGLWYLEVRVGASPLSPRELLTSSAYAVLASSANTLAAAPGALGVSVSTSLFIVSGSSVGIGTTNPGAKLDVAGSVILGSGGTSLMKLLHGTCSPVININPGVTQVVLCAAAGVSASDRVFLNIAGPITDVILESAVPGAASISVTLRNAGAAIPTIAETIHWMAITP